MVSRRRQALRALGSLAGLFLLTATSVASGCATSGTGLRPSAKLVGLIMLGPAWFASGPPCHAALASHWFADMLATALAFAALALASRYASLATLIAVVLVWYFLGYYYWAGSGI